VKDLFFSVLDSTLCPSTLPGPSQGGFPLPMAGTQAPPPREAAALSPLLPAQSQRDGPPPQSHITPFSPTLPSTSTVGGAGPRHQSTGMCTGGGARQGRAAGSERQGRGGVLGEGGGLWERRLGLLDPILLGIGASIGSGIFVATGGSPAGVAPAWCLSFALAGLSLLEPTPSATPSSPRGSPASWGAYLYSYAAFGELPAFLLFCHLMFDYHIGAASIARSLASYLATLVQDALGPGMVLPAVLAPGEWLSWEGCCQ